jgi:hypothetical protein
MLRLTGSRASRDYANEVGEDHVKGAGGGVSSFDPDIVARMVVYLGSVECDGAGIDEDAATATAEGCVGVDLGVHD